MNISISSSQAIAKTSYPPPLLFNKSRSRDAGGKQPKEVTKPDASKRDPSDPCE